MKDKEINEIKEEIQESDAALFKKADINRLNTLESQIEKGFRKASDAYFSIGSALWTIHRNGYYRINGFKNIADYAYERFELSKSTSNNYIRVIDRFADIDGGRVLGIQEKFRPFSCSQLVAMLNFPPELIEKVTPDMPVRKIKGLGKMDMPLNEIPDNANDTDMESEDFAATLETDSFIPPPDIGDGRTFLLESTNFEEIVKSRDSLVMALDNMRNDEKFKGKNVRFVLELVYDQKLMSKGDELCGYI